MSRLHESHPRHVPFKSIYRENFEVVEERRGHVSLYPHTEQLPLLLRALNLEFYGALPDRIARVDRRADGFHKNVLRNSAMIFCQFINNNRADRVRLFELPDANQVYKISIVQQITEDTRLGKTHRFRFYAGADFFPEIRLSGRRLVFADHVMQRFSARVPNNIGDDLRNFLTAFYGVPLISMPCGPSRAFISPREDSIVAFPYREETAGEFFIATCLTVNEINSLKPELPPCAYNFHYAENFTLPARRHWLAVKYMRDYYLHWRDKRQLPPAQSVPVVKWDGRLGYRIRDSVIKEGHGPGTTVLPLDRVHGPHVMLYKPGEKELLIDELEACRNGLPDADWETAFARRDAILRGERPG